MAVIEVHNVTKLYPVRRGTRVMLGRGGLGDWARGKKTGRFAALKDIDLTVNQGESLGIIGRNGSGKSTLLKILAGVTLPTKGRVQVHGRVASLLELGAGFHPMLTGRENAYLNAGLMGMRHAQVDEVIEEIVEFSGIREFIDQPVDTYSSGMYVRLAFAVAVHVNPDVFLVDEVLSVGDEDFQRKCRTKIGELQEQGKTIVFVSHDLGVINAICDRVVLLDKGEMITRNTPQDTITYYLRQVGQESGIHRMANGNLEALFSHGILNLYKDDQEITSGTAIQMHVGHLDKGHLSNTAQWQVSETSPNTCRAIGLMPRLPLRLIWDIELGEGTLSLQLALEITSPIRLEWITLDIGLPEAFSLWYAGSDKIGPPDILPSDSHWSPFRPPDLKCRECFSLPTKDAHLPPIQIALAAESSHTTMEFFNSDYLKRARVVTRAPHSNPPMAVGKHKFATVKIRYGLSEDDGQALARAWDAAHAWKYKLWIQSQNTVAKLNGGCVQILHKGRMLTSSVHCFVGMCIGNLWFSSQALDWTPAPPEGEVLRASGPSTRFPFTLHWELGPVPQGFRWRVWCEATENLEVQEYNVSIALDAAYDHWKTDHEAGEFPPFDPAQSQWRHVNSNFAEASAASASSSSLPTVTITASPESPPVHMTAVNSGHDQQVRVLQALRVPERGNIITLKKGKHLWFDGCITVAP